MRPKISFKRCESYCLSTKVEFDLYGANKQLSKRNFEGKASPKINLRCMFFCQ
jgi:hypothetical protein